VRVDRQNPYNQQVNPTSHRSRPATRLAFVACIAALLVSACTAQPANLPTQTPLAQVPAAATREAATAAPAAGGAEAVSPVTGAPTPLPGARPYAALSPQQRGSIASAPPPLSIDVTKKYLASIVTDKGTIVVELDPSAAPQTVNNFVYLSNNGFYDGLTFHRVEPGFVIQGGDPAGTGGGGPGYNIPPEIKLPHVDGAIAMARTGGPAETTPSSGSQFYITMGAQAALDGNYTAFGRTLSGMNVVTQIAIGDRIQRIDVVEASGAALAAIPLQPTPQPKVAECRVIATNIRADENIRGAKNAPVTLIEYADLQCPSCAAVHPQLKATLDQVSDTVRFVYRHFPLISIHDKATLAARAAEAAAIQGKFDDMVDLLYTEQITWTKTPVAEFTATLKAYATQLQLDPAKLETDMASAAAIARVERDVDSGTSLQLSGTPSLFIDGQPFPREALADPNIVQQIRDYAARRAATLPQGAAAFSFEKPEMVTEKDAVYEMTIETSKGNVVVELNTALAPVNVNSVVFLAQKGYYDNTPVDRNFADPGAVLWGSAAIDGNPGYQCDSETANANFAEAGVVALNTTGPETSSASLVFVYNPSDRLNGQFTVVGKITAGLEIAKSLQGAPVPGPDGATPVPGGKPDTITKVTVTKK
jgi:cyclophilin family peptidyl-prolyl cis-trans isomerase